MALAIGLARASAFTTTDLTSSLLAVVPALLGMWAGQRMHGHIYPATFRRWFFICMLALGLQLLLRHLI